MDVFEAIARIRANHGNDLPGAIRDLRALAKSIATAEQSIRFAALVNHIVGLEGADWKLARELTSDLEGRAEFEQLIRLQGSLAVACYASGQWLDGIRAEGLAVAAAGDSALAVLVWIRCSAGEALVHQQAWETLYAFLFPALRIAGTLASAGDFDKAIASTTNNIASTLLELSKRGARQDELLEQTALTSQRFWQRAGTWENHERADYICWRSPTMRSAGLMRQRQRRSARSRPSTRTAKNRSIRPSSLSNSPTPASSSANCPTSRPDATKRTAWPPRSQMNR